MKIGFFDTETTDLLKHTSAKLELQPRIIELGLLVVESETGEVMQEYDQLINPAMGIPANITKITGITTKDVIGAPYIEDEWPEFKRSVENCDMLVAHNMPFDKGVTEIEMRRRKLALDWPEHMICTVAINEPIYGYRIKLKDLYKEITGNDFDQKHRALDDCAHLAELFFEGDFLEALQV